MSKYVVFEDQADSSQNPELALMRAQGDEAEADDEEMRWYAGMLLTKPKQSNQDKEK